MSVDAQRFTTFVQEGAGIDEGHPARAIAATLATLAERLDRGEARDLASEVPPQARGVVGPAPIDPFASDKTHLAPPGSAYRARFDIAVAEA